MGGRGKRMRLGSCATNDGARSDLEEGGKVVGVKIFRSVRHPLYSDEHLCSVR